MKSRIFGLKKRGVQQQQASSGPWRWCRQVLKGVGGLVFILTCGSATSAEAAERLTVRLGPLEQSFAVRDLEAFAETGELSPALQKYKLFLTPKVQYLLAQRLQIQPGIADQLVVRALRSPEIEQLIGHLGAALPNTSIAQLRVTLYLALREADGLSAISFLKAYPKDALEVDAIAAIGVAIQLNLAYLQSQILTPLLAQELTSDPRQSFRPHLDPSAAGAYTYQKRSFLLHDYDRQRIIPVDLYYSDRARGPLIVFSHGFAADRRFLAYLAEHLASHGFTVASLEHPGSNIRFLSEIPVGLSPGDLLPPSEFIDRPLDISFLLNELERVNQQPSSRTRRFNTEQVTVIGHSLGGYTALALAGAELDLKALRSFCRDTSLLGRSPADWLQCSAGDLPDSKVRLRDPRIVQAIALNPVIGKLFGDHGMEKVVTPTLILSGSEDAITPALAHQLQPFSHLQEPKYLLTVSGGSHMSVTDIRNLHSPMGQSTLVLELMGREAEPIRTWVRGVSLAFIKQLTPAADHYQPFLTPAYAQFLSTPELALRLTTQLPLTTKVWLRGLAFSHVLVAQQQPTQIERSPFNPILGARQSRPFSNYCTGQLNQIFPSLPDNFPKKPDRSLG